MIGFVSEQCPWILRPSQAFGGNRGTRAFISGEQWSKMRGTGERRQFWGTGNKGNQDFDFGE